MTHNIRDVIRDLIRLGIIERANDDSERYPVYRLNGIGEHLRVLLDQANAGQSR